MTRCWAPRNKHPTWGFISFISYASPRGKDYSPRFIRRKFKDHTTVKCNARAGNQLSSPKRCLLNRRQTDLSSGLTSHAYIFYLGSGLRTGTFDHSDLLMNSWGEKITSGFGPQPLSQPTVFPWQLGKTNAKTSKPPCVLKIGQRVTSIFYFSSLLYKYLFPSLSQGSVLWLNSWMLDAGNGPSGEGAPHYQNYLNANWVGESGEDTHVEWAACWPKAAESFTWSISARAFLYWKKRIKECPCGHQDSQSKTPMSGGVWLHISGKRSTSFDTGFICSSF